MKTILLSLLFAIPVLAQSEPQPVRVYGDADDTAEAKVNTLDGLWTYKQKGQRVLKHVYWGRFCMSHIDLKTNIITNHMTGFTSVKEGKIWEKTKVATQDWKKFIGDIRSSEIKPWLVDNYGQESIRRDEEFWFKADIEHDLKPIFDGIDRQVTDIDGVWVSQHVKSTWLKTFDRGVAVLTIFEKRSNEVIHQNWSTYSFDGVTLTEKILFADAGKLKDIGQTFTSSLAWTGRGEMKETKAAGGFEEWVRVGEKPKKTKFEGKLVKGR